MIGEDIRTVAINEKCAAKAVSRGKQRLSDPRAEKRYALRPLRLFSRKDPALTARS